jgi:hypothetical protein
VDLVEQAGGKPITGNAPDMLNGRRPPSASVTKEVDAFALPDCPQGKLAGRAVWHGIRFGRL